MRKLLGFVSYMVLQIARKDLRSPVCWGAFLRNQKRSLSHRRAPCCGLRHICKTLPETAPHLKGQVPNAHLPALRCLLQPCLPRK